MTDKNLDSRRWAWAPHGRGAVPPGRFRKSIEQAVLSV